MRMMTAAAGAMLVAGCATMGTGTGSDSAAATAGGARAVLRMADGTEVGRAVATEAGGGIRVSLDAAKLPAGLHGAHVHTTGRCDGPDFTTAGGHWNPTGMKHGTENPMGPHAGDFPNVQVGADGRGKLDMTLPAGTLAGLMDTDGAAFVIHAAADDYKTDPSGNSGGRIACGVFERS
ncbi:superoxide dismutase [Sphingomonas sp. Leaf33]|nr:superoxide dismutase [Sphingomonas sp. Leaf33]